MPLIIKAPTIIESAGNKPKRIEEYFGRVNSKDETLSIAKMTSPQGWVEPGQRPEFNEYTLVLKGTLQVKTEKETYDVKAGSAILTQKGEWIQYSTPLDGGAEYVAVCLPAFSREIVNWDS
jgi:quercetin dioxygenase-like cupin family protein